MRAPNRCLGHLALFFPAAKHPDIQASLPGTIRPRLSNPRALQIVVSEKERKAVLRRLYNLQNAFTCLEYGPSGGWEKKIFERDLLALVILDPARNAGR
jgi:hypothetical protein